MDDGQGKHTYAFDTQGRLVEGGTRSDGRYGGDVHL